MSFSGDGKRVADFNGTANAVTVQANGKIVAVGGSESSGSASATSPSPATTPTARSTRASPATASRRPTSAEKTRPTGWRSRRTARSSWSAAAGTRHNGIGFALARYNPNGTLDTSFSGDGKQTTEFDLGSGQVANAVVMQDDGKIIVVGNAFGPMFSEDFAIARYNPNGTLDTSFSGDGRQTASFLTPDEANGVAIQGDGKIVVVGTGVDNITGVPRVAVVRYNPNGTLDTSFSGDGKQTTDFGTRRAGEWGGDSGDGKIVVGGLRGRRRQQPRLRPRPLQPDGSLDTSFSGDGTQTTDFGGSDGAAGVALQGDGKIVRWARPNPAPAATTSPSPATTPTARSTRPSPATASDDRLRVRGRRRGERRRGPGRRQDRRGRLRQRRGHRRRLRPRPLQPRRLARHDLLRRRQTEDQLRGRRRGERGGAPGGRQDRRGRARPRFRRNQRLRARPLPGGLTRPVERSANGVRSTAASSIRAPMAPFMPCGPKKRQKAECP